MLHYLTSCSIDWCSGFAANFVVIIQITQLFILKFHLNLKGANARGLSFSYCSKSVAAETKCQFWLYYHKFTDFVFWIIESMVHWTASSLAALIDLVGSQLIEVVSIICIAQLVILYFYNKNQNKSNYLFLAVEILLQKLGINFLL